MSKSEDTRARILNAALDAAPRGGLAALSIGRLAAATGMSKSGLFGRFGGQEPLQLAVVEAAIARFRVAVVEPARGEKAAAGRLKALAARWTDWLTTGRLCPILQAGFEHPSLAPAAADAARQARREWTGFIEQLARRAALEGGLPAGTDPALFAFSFEACGLAAQSYAALQNRKEAAELAGAAFAKLLEPGTA